MAKSKFPETIYVKIENDGSDDQYMSANDDVEALADIGESPIVAQYSLVRTAKLRVNIDWVTLKQSTAYGKAKRTKLLR